MKKWWRHTESYPNLVTYLCNGNVNLCTFMIVFVSYTKYPNHLIKIFLPPWLNLVKKKVTARPHRWCAAVCVWHIARIDRWRYGKNSTLFFTNSSWPYWVVLVLTYITILEWKYLPALLIIIFPIRKYCKMSVRNCCTITLGTFYFLPCCASNDTILNPS